jgi:aspartate 1-decarboxylase
VQRQLLKSKIHRATVTAHDPDYVGSITLDSELMRAADLLPNEQVHVWDVVNASRFVTYAIEGPPGSGAVEVNGAAALLVAEGDKVIVTSFGAYGEAELAAYDPVVVHVDARNRIARVDSRPEVLLDSPLASEAGFSLPGELTPTGGAR